jgi:hypothetical protein
MPEIFDSAEKRTLSPGCSRLKLCASEPYGARPAEVF